MQLPDPSERPGSTGGERDAPVDMRAVNGEKDVVVVADDTDGELPAYEEEEERKKQASKLAQTGKAKQEHDRPRSGRGQPQGAPAQPAGASAQGKPQPGGGGEPSGGGGGQPGGAEAGGGGGPSLKKAGVATAAGVVGTKAALVGVGFGSAGITGGSIAAGIQAGIGNVAAGSTFAVLQSMGAGAVMGWAAPGAVVGLGGYGAYLGYKAVKRALSGDTDAPPPPAAPGPASSEKPDSTSQQPPAVSDNEIEYPSIEFLLENLHNRAARRRYPSGPRPDYRSYAPLLQQHGFYHVDALVRHTSLELASALQIPLGLAGDIHEEATRLVNIAKEGKAPTKR